ncbi:MAG: UDP-N-acetylglucosamine 1-carboxyvinyltransferase, UDP-N-acetylglucosamine 1-carboxyvinyltransferase [Candidatus Taylorbacteria bacterium]|nr:UDP-N-acetylglucosamine 1-carboxyvinyltransferase, UDP-N-acetylglucosamine 1-carboxyvinyltransferase [Candidatus Taylorbacteria bacterium]
MKKDTLIVEGLAGKKSLNGEVRINGAKNAALKVMAASVLFDGPMKLMNAPHTEDTNRVAELITILGGSVVIDKKEITIDASSIDSTDLDPDLARSMRSSVLLTGPMLGRYGKVKFPVPGGCVIGARPIDLFISAYEKLGAEVKLESSKGGDQYAITAKKLKGAEIFFNLQTVTGTETIMMAAVLAEGKTVLRNCAMEPEITSLAEFLNSCGAKIHGAGTTTITIGGLGSGGLLKAKHAYETIPDRVETGSFLLLGVLCADNLKITHCNPEHIEVLISHLRESGANIIVTKDTIELRDNAKLKNSSLKPFNIRTHEYPGFSTDLQAPMTVFLTQVGADEINPNSGARGESIVFETIYEGRFKYVSNLEKLGAQLTVMNPREILVKGGASLKAPEPGEELEAYDIRAGFATIMAALVAKGTSVIKNAYFIDRGYENIEGRLAALGADVRRVHADEQPEIVI